MKKTTYAASFLALAATQSFATSPTSAVLSNYSNSEYTIYTDTGIGNPSQLALSTDLTLLPSVLDGDISHAGGNIELYLASDTESFVNFTNAERVQLDVTLPGGVSSTLSSLNGSDWFDDGTTYNTSYGANNLANAWFSDLLTELNTFPTLATIITGNEQNLFEAYRDNDGFQQLSDPNISYVEHDGTNVVVGLGGLIDVRERFVQLAVDSGVDPVLANFVVPQGIQMSEVVLIDGQAAYGFSAVESGVVYKDDVDSYAATYEVGVTVPEPTSTLLVGLGAFAFTLRRQRA